MNDLSQYLCSTEYIDSDAPTIRDLAMTLKRETHKETAIAAFNWVRDNVVYDAFHAIDGRAAYKASAVLARGAGYCTQKAVVLAAVARAAGVPTRLGFADLRNHKLPQRLIEMMGTNLFTWHGYVEFYIDGAWVKATPAFDPESTRKAGALMVELDGEHDATLHPVDPEGAPHMEYIRDRGSFADLPIEEIRQGIIETYPEAAAHLED